MCRIGLNIEDLYDFDLAHDTFGAVIWLWSLCPSSEMSPLETIALPTATTNLKLGEVQSTDAGEHGVYQSRRIQGTFRHNWDMRHYPFDHHRIAIPFDESELGAEVVIFEPDTKDSFLSPAIDERLEEWSISDFALEATVEVQPSSYGFPGSTESRFSRLEARFGLERTQLLTFFKLTSGLVAAALIALLSFVYDPRDSRGFYGRLALLAGTLFAVLVSMSIADSTIGDSSQLTLVTELHLVTLVLIVFLALFSMRERRRAEKELPIAHPNWRMFMVTAALYVLVCAGLIAQAAWA